MSPQPELIRGGLKYAWGEGRSKAVQPTPTPRVTTVRVCKILITITSSLMYRRRIYTQHSLYNTLAPTDGAIGSTQAALIYSQIGHVYRFYAHTGEIAFINFITFPVSDEANSPR